MEKEFKKLFSGLLQEAGDKAGEGKLLVKNAIHKITGSPGKNEPATPAGISKTSSDVTSKKETTTKKSSTSKPASAFQQNLRKLKQYGNEEIVEDDASLADDILETEEASVKLSSVTVEEKKASGVNPKAHSGKTSSDKRRIEAAYAKNEAPEELSLDPLDPLSSEQTDELVDDIEAEKRKLSERIANWQQTLSDEMGYSFSATEDNVQINEVLVERLQTVLDLISGQIHQIQAKKNEQEAQKLLFDSTYETLNQEREAYRLSIEELTRQISQKHDELSKYMLRWEEDSKLWTDRKEDAEMLRQEAMRAQQQYQQSIATQVNQLESRQQTLAGLNDKMHQQKAESERTLEEIRSMKEASIATQEAYRQQIADLVGQLQVKQSELEHYMTSWDDRLLAWQKKAEELQENRQIWDTLLSSVEHQIETQQADYQRWLDQQLAALDSREKELSGKGDLALKAISAFNQDITDKHNHLVKMVEQKIQAQQTRFDEKQKQLISLADGQITVLTEKLAQTNEAYLALSKEHQRQMAETLASQPDIVTEAIWKNRLSYAVTFLPQLPVYVSSDDLSALFGGIAVHFNSPYVPPTEATIQIKWHLFNELPETEKALVRTLCKEISANYRIEFHPIVQMIAQ